MHLDEWTRSSTTDRWAGGRGAVPTGAQSGYRAERCAVQLGGSLARREEGARRSETQSSLARAAGWADESGLRPCCVLGRDAVSHGPQWYRVRGALQGPSRASRTSPRQSPVRACPVGWPSPARASRRRHTDPSLRVRTRPAQRDGRAAYRRRPGSSVPSTRSGSQAPARSPTCLRSADRRWPAPRPHPARRRDPAPRSRRGGQRSRPPPGQPPRDTPPWNRGRGGRASLRADSAISARSVAN